MYNVLGEWSLLQQGGQRDRTRWPRAHQCVHAGYLGLSDSRTCQRGVGAGFGAGGCCRRVPITSVDRITPAFGTLPAVWFCAVGQLTRPGVGLGSGAPKKWVK
jgi:hypothetical protein